MSDNPIDPDDITTVSVSPAISASVTDNPVSLTTTTAPSLVLTSDSLGSLPGTTAQAGLTIPDISTAGVQGELLTFVSSSPTVLSSPTSSGVLQTSRVLSVSGTLSSSQLLSTSKAVINVIPSVTFLHTSHSLSVTPLHPSSKSIVATTSSVAIPSSINNVSPTISSPSAELSTSISPIQSLNTTSSSSPKHNYTLTGAILGAIGTVFLLSALASSLIWIYKRRRAASCSSPIWPTFPNDHTNFNSSPDERPPVRGNEMQEMSYEGSRRFRFPQYHGVLRRPLTFSPPGTISSSSNIQFPSENSLHTTQRKISPPFLLPPSLEQSLTRPFVVPERQLCSEDRLKSEPESVSKPPTDSNEVSLPSMRKSRVLDARKSPSMLVSAIIPQSPILQIENLQTPSTVLDSDSCSSPIIELPKPAFNTLLTPRTSTFLLPPAPKYTPMKATAIAAATPPVSISLKLVDKQSESKDLEPDTGILPERFPSWASSLRTNLFHAVKYMNLKRDTAEQDQDQPPSDNSSSLYSEETTSESESLRSATGTVPSEVKRPIRRTWVVVNGGTERQSVESSCGL
ncbi:hypothetical protein Clacol_003301 [Clathrus columnatus]|uniref:Uncharacterized protein n=1 Tax=Clathrus columnatus TaxID=1419009 RepID=A0AAV5A762_9AGAM|nr:hypothetical protein Clacol_003301 [Clathrus columnatus]